VNLQFFSIVFLLEEVEELEILAIRKGHKRKFDISSMIDDIIKNS
jgi:hypothetical protein